MISYDSEFEVLMFDCSRFIYFWKQVYNHIVNIPYNWIIRGSPRSKVPTFPQKIQEFIEAQGAGIKKKGAVLWNVLLEGRIRHSWHLQKIHRSGVFWGCLGVDRGRLIGICEQRQIRKFTQEIDRSCFETHCFPKKIVVRNCNCFIQLGVEEKKQKKCQNTFRLFSPPPPHTKKNHMKDLYKQLNQLRLNSSSELEISEKNNPRNGSILDGNTKVVQLVPVSGSNA